MSRAVSSLANRLWWLSCLPEASAFRRAARDARSAQREVLSRLLRSNAESEFGRAHGFASIRTVAEFRQRVPLATYDEYAAAVTRIAAGARSVLTSEPPLLLEPTSGSSRATKLVPYTAALAAEFRRGIAPWIADLYGHEPSLRDGEAYWSLTPVARRGDRTPGGLAIGFEEDAEYLGPVARRLAASVMAAPPELKLVADMDAFRYATLLFLLRSRRLALVSVWNPTFLTLLVGKLEIWSDRLARDLERGTITPPGDVDDDVLGSLSRHVASDPRRAREVREAAGLPAAEAHARLWPALRVISCWADAAAAPHARALARIFPQARTQPKGLLATEGFVSLPLHGHEGAALAVRSHFFEFLPEGESDALEAHEIEEGRSYAVVLSTGAGFYRYRLGDLVRVEGWLGTIPLLRFLGREDAVSDVFGEKVHERHVVRALDIILDRCRPRPSFALVSCEDHDGEHAYTLFVEGDADLVELGASLEAVLRENFHYAYCRDLGQLGPARAVRARENALESYLAARRARGMREGDVKPIALARDRGWLSALAHPGVAELRRRDMRQG